MARRSRTPERMAAEQAWEEIHAYLLHLGMVAQAWNSLHEALCGVFTTVIQGRDRDAVEAVWHSTYSDRSQREMLRHAIEATADLHNRYKDDLLWVLKRANELSGMRDDAIHAPILAVGGGEKLEVVASFISAHRRAKHLVGKDLIVEFDYCKRYTELLTAFVNAALASLSPLVGGVPWPDRPSAPNRRPRKTLLGRPRRRPLPE